MVLLTGADVDTGRQAWQSAGGMQLGSIWGHGAYLAPDWSADWLHRESVALLEGWSQAEFGTAFAELHPERQAALQARLKQEMAANRYDPASGDLVVSADRAAAIKAVARHYIDLFGNAPDLSALREQYAMPENAMPDVARRNAMTAFFFWTSWASAAERPGEDGITYTNNWPYEPLLGHAPTTGSVVWSVLSVILLIAGVGALVWYHAVTSANQPHAKVPATDPLASLKPTPSMRATGKYFATVIALFLAQIGLGALTAHYAVEGQDFYGFPIADYLPYAVTRTRFSVFEPIVPVRQFGKAQERLAQTRNPRWDKETIISALQRLLEQKGGLSQTLINGAKDAPCSETVTNWFGSLDAAYAAAGYHPQQQSQSGINGKYWSEKAVLSRSAKALRRAGSHHEPPCQRLCGSAFPNPHPAPLRLAARSPETGGLACSIPQSTAA